MEILGATFALDNILGESERGNSRTIQHCRIQKYVSVRLIT